MELIRRAAPEIAGSRARARIFTVATATMSVFAITSGSPGMADDAPDAGQMTHLPPWLSNVSLPDQPTCFGESATMFFGPDDIPAEIHGTAGNDVIVVETSRPNPAGRDNYILSKIGDDYICTFGPGAFLVYGAAGQDKISTGSGNDRIYGELGVDLLSGGAGDDKIDGGFAGGVARGDTAHGGDGTDTCRRIRRSTTCES